MCKKAPKFSEFSFCGKQCKNAAEKAGPMMLEVPQEHVMFKNGLCCIAEALC
jgi:hypothetical protein